MKTQMSFEELIQNIEKEIHGEDAEVAEKRINEMVNANGWSYIEFMLELNKCAAKNSVGRSVRNIHTICHFCIH